MENLAPADRKRKAKPALIKSPSDKRAYRIIELPNGLKATLISTAEGIPGEGKRRCLGPEANDQPVGSRTNLKCLDTITARQKLCGFAAASLVVRCGTFNDPPELEGAAHFLDHMVLLGSEKYPNEDDYLRYVCKHGGSTNAFAAREITIFQLEIMESALPEALDRLANLVIKPKFRNEAIEREINALQCELWLRQCSDPFRLVELLSHLVGRDHPMGLFRWGNIDTLITKPRERNADLRNELLTFFDRYYSADRMTLCVQSMATIDQLEELVHRCFCAIPPQGQWVSKPALWTRHPPPGNDPSIHPLIRPAPFSQNSNFCKLHKIIPLYKELTITFFWVLPPQKRFYKEKSVDYLTYIVGHECKDGLYDNLKNKGWAFRLSAGVERDGFKDCSYCTMFSIEINLTPDGAHNVDEVTQLVHQFMHMVRKVGPQKQLWDDLKDMTSAQFRFMTPVEALETVQDISLSMNYFSEEHYLCGSYLYMNYDPEHIQSLIDLMTPEKCSIMLMNHEFEEEVDSFQREPWMGMRFSVEDYPSHWQRLWNDDEGFQSKFRLPDKNHFLATDFTIVEYDPAKRKVPTLLESSLRGQLWYLRGNKYTLPKCFVNMNLKGAPRVSIEDVLSIEIMVQMLSYELSDLNSYLELAFIEMNLGVELTFKGFSQKIPSLVRTVVDRLTKLDCSSETFKMIKFGLARDYYNSVRQNKRYAEDIMATILQRGHRSLSEKHTSIQAITKHDVKRRIRECCNAGIDAYMHGNITSTEARDLFSYIESKLNQCPLKGGSLPMDCTISYPHEGYCHSGLAMITREIYVRVLATNTEEKCSRIINYYVGGKPGSMKDELMFQLLLIMVRAESILLLRTRWQLGYDPGCEFRHHGGIFGFAVSISPMAEKFTLSFIDEKIDEFVEAMLQKFTTLDRAEFEVAKDTLIKVKLSPADSTIEGEQQRYWNQIVGQHHPFVSNQAESEAQNAREIDYDSFRSSAMSFLSHVCTNRPKVSVQVVGYGKAALEECVGGEQIWQAYNMRPNKDMPQIGDNIPEKRTLVPKDVGTKRYVTDFNKFFLRSA